MLLVVSEHGFVVAHDGQVHAQFEQIAPEHPVRDKNADLVKVILTVSLIL